MAANCVDEVELGFTEKPEDPKRLTSPYFPSKIGGKPAWLDPHLPVPDVLTCRKCGKPRVFLLQVYAPIDHLAHCYHRTLYVFCCREPSCHSRNFTEQFLVLRCNLPQLDSSYDSKAKGLSDGSAINDEDDPGAANSSTRNKSKNGLAVTIHSIAQYDLAPEDATTGNSQSNSDAVTNVSDAVSNVVDSNDESLMQEQQRKSLESTLKLLPPLCVVCGCSGPKWCAKCHSMYYCSREHQVIHWKAGHKKHCGDEKQPTNIDAAGRMLFEEFEIVTEPEPPIKVTPERSEEERLKDYHKYLEKLSGKSEMDKMYLDDVDKDVKKDKQFMTFKKRIAVEPDQVIRYQRGGIPLWISSENLPIQIPDCERCGSKRVFEFQVMPQLLYYLRLDSTECASIDWGTLSVYTCGNSCASTPTDVAYQQEFLWKQDPSVY